jgi:hypothetical protein
VCVERVIQVLDALYLKPNRVVVIQVIHVKFLRAGVLLVFENFGVLVHEVDNLLQLVRGEGARGLGGPRHFCLPAL